LPKILPEASVRKLPQMLQISTRCKRYVGGKEGPIVKIYCEVDKNRIPLYLRTTEVIGMLNGTMECDDLEWNSNGEGRLLGCF